VIQQQSNHLQIARLAREVQRAASTRQTAAAAAAAAVTTFDVTFVMVTWNCRLVVRLRSVLHISGDMCGIYSMLSISLYRGGSIGVEGKGGRATALSQRSDSQLLPK